MKNILFKILLGIFINYSLSCYFMNTNMHIILTISVGLSLLLLFVPVVLHFFIIRNYFFNNVFISFLLILGGLLFFTTIAFYKIGFNNFNFLTGILLYSFLSSIIYNLMYYFRK